MNREEWIKKTRERAAIMLEAAERVEAGDPWETICVQYRTGEEGNRVVWDFGLDIACTLKPRRKLRAWTAKEWGARIEYWFLFGHTKNRLTGIELEPFKLKFRTEFSDASFCADDGDLSRITQRDGTPCGEMEDAK